jgi:hypothetical protein
LEKIADARRKREAALGGVKALDELGAIVTGVNDAPETVSFGGDASAAAGSEPKSLIPAYVPNPANRGKVFDASEGTPLDPLLNKTYDLSSAKDIPVLNK